MDLFYEDTKVVATHRYMQAIKELVEADREMLTLSGIPSIGAAYVEVGNFSKSSNLKITYDEALDSGKASGVTLIKAESECAVDGDVVCSRRVGPTVYVNPALGGDEVVTLAMEEFTLPMGGMPKGLWVLDTPSLVKLSKDLGDIDLEVFTPTVMGKSNEL